jgi:hypothetical protein
MATSHDFLVERTPKVGQPKGKKWKTKAEWKTPV